MYKWLKPESKFVQNAGVISNIPRTIGSVIAWSDNPVTSVSFVMSTLTGFTWGQTQTGRITQYGMGFIGYSAMALDGLKNIEQPAGQFQFVSAVGSLMSMSRMIIDEYKGSHYERLLSFGKTPAQTGDTKQEPTQSSPVRQAFDFVTCLPKKGVQAIAQACQSSTHERISQFGHDLQDVTNRRGFASATFGLSCNILYSVSGLLSDDPSVMQTRLKAGSQWGLANAISAIAVSKDGQKNIITEWYETARDKMKSVFHNKNDQNGPTSSGSKAQVA